MDSFHQTKAINHINLYKMERNSIWQSNGITFGYPQCCIDSFCKTHGFMNADENQRTVAQNGFGFIPCATHAKQILNNEITIESLIKNRDPEINDFPNDQLRKR